MRLKASASSPANGGLRPNRRVISPLRCSKQLFPSDRSNADMMSSQHWIKHDPEEQNMSAEPSPPTSCAHVSPAPHGPPGKAPLDKHTFELPTAHASVLEIAPPFSVSIRVAVPQWSAV
jgi:hypothetical protein